MGWIEQLLGAPNGASRLSHNEGANYGRGCLARRLWFTGSERRGLGSRRRGRRRRRDRSEAPKPEYVTPAAAYFSEEKLLNVYDREVVVVCCTGGEIRVILCHGTSAFVPPIRWADAFRCGRT